MEINNQEFPILNDQVFRSAQLPSELLQQSVWISKVFSNTKEYSNLSG